jgi:hypothetical protein
MQLIFWKITIYNIYFAYCLIKQLCFSISMCQYLLQMHLCVSSRISVHIQWYLGLRVTWFASVLQDNQQFLINFNFINEPCLAIRVLYYLHALSAERHVIASRSGLWVIVSHAQSQSAYLIRKVSIRASVVITCVCVKHFFILCRNVVTVLY